MKYIARIYDNILSNHLKEYRQMVFLSGPRQVGKTTFSRRIGDYYIDWDNRDHQRLILGGPESIAGHCHLHEAVEKSLPIVIFDELHKYSRWKNFLKGLFDTYEDRCRIIVTGSAKLDIYRRGGDSLMGRYFPYRLHPFSIAEILKDRKAADLISPPSPVSDYQWTRLCKFGGFPEPFVKKNNRFLTRWRTLRKQRLIREDIQDLSRIHEISLLEQLADMLAEHSGDQLVYANAARHLQVSPHTLKEWVNTLAMNYYGFLVRPWFKNVNKALRKEPKWYLRDWSGIHNEGARTETFGACHLLKSVEFWTDTGLGEFELRYIRDKQKREIDFLVVRDRQPWFLVEMKQKETDLSPALPYFQKQVKAEHAFQVVMDMPYKDVDCFKYSKPVVVPARTFFSQLI